MSSNRDGFQYNICSPGTLSYHRGNKCQSPLNLCKFPLQPLICSLHLSSRIPTTDNFYYCQDWSQSGEYGGIGKSPFILHYKQNLKQIACPWVAPVAPPRRYLSAPATQVILVKIIDYCISELVIMEAFKYQTCQRWIYFCCCEICCGSLSVVWISHIKIGHIKRFLRRSRLRETFHKTEPANKLSNHKPSHIS